MIIFKSFLIIMILLVSQVNWAQTWQLNKQHEQIIEWVSGQGLESHYSRLLGDIRGSHKNIVVKYLEQLDPTKSIFLQADVSRWIAYYKKNNDFLALQKIYEEYLEKKTELGRQMAWHLNQISFESDLIWDSSPQTWPKDREAWQMRAKKRALADAMILIDRGVATADIQAILTQRYQHRVKALSTDPVRSAEVAWINALTTALDPYSRYTHRRPVPPRPRQAQQDPLAGIGVILEKKADESFLVKELIPGGASQRSGKVALGDRIFAIASSDNEFISAEGMSLQDAAGMLRGEKGSVVTFRVLNLFGEIKEIEITRDEFVLADGRAQGEVRDFNKKVRIGVITVPSFYRNIQGASVSQDIRVLLNDFAKQNVQMLVLDLRNNPGGDLDEAVRVAGTFLGKNFPVAQVRSADESITIHRSEVERAYNGPLVILVNARSASASELVAASLQDYGRGVVVGVPTFGKGTVQRMINYQGSYLRWTVASYYTAKGKSPQYYGVRPDVEFPVDFDFQQWGESSVAGALKPSAIQPLKPAAGYKVSPINVDILTALRSDSQSRVAENLKLQKHFRQVQRELERDVQDKVILSIEKRQQKRTQLKQEFSDYVAHWYLLDEEGRESLTGAIGKFDPELDEALQVAFDYWGLLRQ